VNADTFQWGTGLNQSLLTLRVPSTGLPVTVTVVPASVQTLGITSDSVMLTQLDGAIASNVGSGHLDVTTATVHRSISTSNE